MKKKFIPGDASSIFHSLGQFGRDLVDTAVVHSDSLLLLASLTGYKPFGMDVPRPDSISMEDILHVQNKEPKVPVTAARSSRNNDGMGL